MAARIFYYAENEGEQVAHPGGNKIMVLGTSLAQVLPHAFHADQNMLAREKN